jgi:Family of unknown function (DUF6502)
MKNSQTPHGLQAEQQALLGVVARLLKPLARLCLAKGISIQAVEDVIRRAYVMAAQQSCGEVKTSRLNSRISTMTGLTRREIARIQSTQTPSTTSTRSIATDVLTLWTSQLDYVNKKGQPIPIPRNGDSPSFEALASMVTKDVHPKSILAEMQRLGLVAHNQSNDIVSVVDAIYVPRNNWPEMVSFIGFNVGDHLEASVDNVLTDGHQHFEQSLLADELSNESLKTAKSMILAQWRELMTKLGPQLQTLMDKDKSLQREQSHQVRIGLYSYMTAMPPSADESEDTSNGRSHAQ